MSRRVAGDLRRPDSHCDVIVMVGISFSDSADEITYFYLCSLSINEVLWTDNEPDSIKKIEKQYVTRFTSPKKNIFCIKYSFYFIWFGLAFNPKEYILM